MKSDSPPAVPGYVKAPDGSPLYCVFHPAAQAADPQRARLPVLVLPSLFEERKSAYAALRRLAERLAAAGHAVLRFDYRGSGESGGDPAQRRWHHLGEDVATARETLARLTGVRDAVLIGLRMGATLALQQAALADYAAVIALAPVIKGASHVRLWKMRSKIRSELTQANTGSEAQSGTRQPASDVLDFDGYEVNKNYFDDVAKIDLTKELSAQTGPGLVLQLSHRVDAAPETLELLKKLGPRVQNACMRVEQFWDKVDDVDTRPVEDAVLKFLA